MVLPYLRSTDTNWWGLCGRIALSLSLIWLAFWWVPTQIEWQRLALVNATTLLACATLFAAMLVLLSWRWKMVLQAVSRNDQVAPSLGRCTALLWFGLGVNQVLPSIIGGDVARAVLLARRGVNLDRAAWSVVIDRTFGLSGLLIICLAGTFSIASEALGAVYAASAVLVLTIAGACATVFMLRSVVPGLSDIISGLRQLSVRLAFLLLVAATLGHLMNFAIFLLLAWGLGLDLPVIMTLAILAGVMLVSALPISIAGWGIREISLVQAFATVAVPAEQIIVASIVFGIFLFVTHMAGLGLLLKRGLL